MNSKPQQSFLGNAGWGDATRDQMAGDASARRYERLNKPDGKSAILMINPNSDDLARFLRADTHFDNIELSVPQIFATDPGHGLCLMEDFGPLVFAKVISHQPEHERPLYAAATDALTHIQRAKTPDWAEVYDADMMARFVDPAWDHYARMPTDTPGWIDAKGALHALLADTEAKHPVLLHRDYHVENLVWLPDRKGVARVGLLDFQDALGGHPAYDLVSLLQDARRDVAPDLEEEMIRRYLKFTDHDPTRFRRAYAVQGVQRHLRILGIFARLTVERAKPTYLDLLPRVWSMLERALEHSDLRELRERLLTVLPPPTPTHLSRLGAGA